MYVCMCACVFIHMHALYVGLVELGVKYSGDMVAYRSNLLIGTCICTCLSV